MTVSIIIPCFNHGRFLAAAIESAQRQAGPQVEVIVVDDGSTDDSAAVAAQYPRVTLIRQPNGGLSRARNAGLAAARGDCCIFLDADDRLLPGAARAAVETFDVHPDAAMVVGRCRLVDERGRPLATALPDVQSDFYRELLRTNYIWMTAMVAFRRSVFARVGDFDPRVNASADYDMYLRVARRLPLARHGELVAEYRQHDANMSRDPVLMLESTLAVMRVQAPFARGDTALGSAYREGIRRWRQWYGERLVERFRDAWRTGAHRDAARAAGHLLRLYPRGVWRHIRRKMIVMRGARSGQPKLRPPSLARPPLPGGDD